jgi:hypothetical protein
MVAVLWQKDGNIFVLTPTILRQFVFLEVKFALKKRVETL